jgi:hypothetical protein
MKSIYLLLSVLPINIIPNNRPHYDQLIDFLFLRCRRIQLTTLRKFPKQRLTFHSENNKKRFYSPISSASVTICVALLLEGSVNLI